MVLRENLLTESISKLALREAIVVDPTTLIRDAVVLMCNKRLGCVIVAKEDRIPIGVFTERELMKLLARDASALDEQVGNHLAPNWATVRQSDPIAKALEAMQKNRMRFVCVTNDEGKAIALTGQKGLMEYIAEHFPQVVLTQAPGTTTFTEREGA